MVFYCQTAGEEVIGVGTPKTTMLARVVVVNASSAASGSMLQVAFVLMAFLIRHGEANHAPPANKSGHHLIK